MKILKNNQKNSNLTIDDIFCIFNQEKFEGIKMNSKKTENKDFLWLNKHTPELQDKYAGKWIAVINQEIVGSGDSATEAFSKAQKKYPNVKPLLDFVPTEECLIL